MSPREIRITFQPSGRTVYALPGTPVIEAAGRAGIILQSPCGGRGTCGKCRVRLLTPDAAPPPASVAGLTETQIARGVRLACQTRLHADVAIEIPSESTFEHAQRILTHDHGAASDLAPACVKHYVELTPPSSADPVSDLSRLLAAAGPAEMPPHLVRLLPGLLRQAGWKATVTRIDDRVVAVEGGDTRQACHGVAIDLGTTTVVGTLVDLTSGRECAVASHMNPQVAYGDDVISRLMHLRNNAGGLADLQTSVVDCLNMIIETLVVQAGIPAAAIYELTVAGNSTMQQILCGYDASALGEVPFVQVFDEAQRVPAAQIGLRVNPHAEVYVFPQIGGFVGGDTVAGIVAARLDRAERPMLFVDIGTNGEMVLAAGGTLLATSTAAGPAFEGARIRQGMRATAGAIETVVVTDDLAVNVIGNTRPAGLCGTGLIDAAAELLRAGMIDETGRILPPAEAPAALPAALRDRLVTHNGDTHVVLVPAAQAAGGEAIMLWQRDVRELQLATAAVRAGIELLLRRAGIGAADLGGVLLAGAFGNFIRRSNARRIGLLPQIPCARIRFIGNAASLGARLVLLSRGEREYAETLRRRAAHVDLSLDPAFQMAFANAMLFPDGDLDACDDEPGA